jgi:hypothetical protein
VADLIIAGFPISGRILDPCRGNGVFYDRLPGADWCELQAGRDFFEANGPYDWIVGNPPYSIYGKWLRHSMEIAENVLYLIPIIKVFADSNRLREVSKWGGVCEILHIGPGRALKWPVNYAIAAVHYQRGYHGPIRMTDAATNEV